MSNYKLTSPVDVSSSSVTGQLNIFSLGTSFAFQIKAPTLTSNVPFVLPAVAGTTNQYLTYGATPTWTTQTIVTSTTSLPLSFSFITGVNTAAQNANTTFTNVGAFYFFGTTTEGTPSAIYAVIGGIASVGARVRVFDNTNAVTIGTSAAVSTTTTPQIVQIPITTPFSAAAAQLYVQISRTTSGTVRIWTVQILP